MQQLAYRDDHLGESQHPAEGGHGMLHSKQSNLRQSGQAEWRVLLQHATKHFQQP